MRISTLIFIYTKHFAYLKVYTKFHNHKSSCCWENSDEKRPCLLGVTEGKIEKGKMSFSIFFFYLHNTLSLPEGVHKIWKHWLQ